MFKWLIAKNILYVENSAFSATISFAYSSFCSIRHCPNTTLHSQVAYSGCDRSLLIEGMKTRDQNGFHAHF